VNDRALFDDLPATDKARSDGHHDRPDTRWDAIQTGFVDEPRAAVEQADALVGEMLKRLTDAGRLPD
jgi:hypothetical protein